MGDEKTRLENLLLFMKAAPAVAAIPVAVTLTNAITPLPDYVANVRCPPPQERLCEARIPRFPERPRGPVRIYETAVSTSTATASMMTVSLGTYLTMQSN